eukprot:860191_1
MQRSAYSHAVEISEGYRSNPLHIASTTSFALPIVYHNDYNIELWDAKHRLGMSKSKYILEHLQQNNFNFNQLYCPSVPSNEDISIAHSTDYINKLHFGDTNLFESASLPP